MRVSRDVASFATYLHAALAQGVELRAAGNEVDLTPCTGERSTDVGADRAGSEHCDSHGSRPFHREIRVQYVVCNMQSSERARGVSCVTAVYSSAGKRRVLAYDMAR